MEILNIFLMVASLVQTLVIVYFFAIADRKKRYAQFLENGEILQVPYRRCDLAKDRDEKSALSSMGLRVRRRNDGIWERE